MKELTSMTIFDRFNIGVVAAAAGLCGIAIALSPEVAAAPLITGGNGCHQTTAGEAGSASPAAADGMPVAGGAGGLPVAGPCSPASAPLADMAGIPMALPGPVPVAAPVPLAAPAPLAAPVPLGGPVPVVAPAAAPVPLAAPLPAGAPLLDMSGGYGGKGDPIAPPSADAPVSGQPILPGPGAGGAR